MAQWLNVDWFCIFLLYIVDFSMQLLQNHHDGTNCSANKSPKPCTERISGAKKPHTGHTARTRIKNVTTDTAVNTGMTRGQ